MTTFFSLSSWSAVLLQASWQAGLLVLVAGTVCRLFPAMPARYQCWLWRLIFIKCLLCFFGIAPLELPLLPARPVASLSESTIAVTATSTPTTAALPFSTLPEQNRTTLPSLPALLFVAWTFGVAWYAIRLFAAWRKTRKLAITGRFLDDSAWQEEFLTQQKLFIIRRRPELLEIDGGGSPMLVGIVRPAILIPAETIRRLTAHERAMVLGHEMAHLARGDLIWSLLASLLRALFFFHPLIWAAERQLKLVQETAVDALVIARQKRDIVDYGNILVSIVGKLGSRRTASPVVLETAGPIHSLTRRLVAMNHFEKTSRRVLVGSFVLLGAVAIVGLVPWRLVAAEASPTDQKSPRSAEVKLQNQIKTPDAASPVVGLAPGSVVSSPLPIEVDGGSFLIKTEKYGTRAKAIDKKSGNSQSIDLAGDSKVVDVAISGDIAACTLTGTPEQLILYNAQIGEWKTFPVDIANHTNNITPIVGKHVACFQLPHLIVAYSVTKDKWGASISKATPVVGDEAVIIDTDGSLTMFTAENGSWADFPLAKPVAPASPSPAPAATTDAKRLPLPVTKNVTDVALMSAVEDYTRSKFKQHEEEFKKQREESAKSPLYQIACRWIETDKDGKEDVLTAPTITTFDGQSAIINCGTQSPIMTGVKRTQGGEEPNIAVLEEGWEIHLTVLADVAPGKVTFDATLEQSKIGDITIKNNRQRSRTDSTKTRIIESLAFGEKLVVKLDNPPGTETTRSVEFVVRTPNKKN